jgi:hypothetical protein
MRDEDFEKVMDTWADREAESAPEMRPTADMYRMVQAKRERGPVFFLGSRWAAVGTAMAGLVMLVVVYAVLFHPSIFPRVPSGQEVAFVGQREGFASEKGVIMEEPGVPPRKGPKKGPIAFEQLVFHFQERDSRFVQGIDLQAPWDETLALTSADNYRLLLEPIGDRYVYVFQLTSTGVLVELFPNETYSSAQNPLRQGQTYYLPPEPNWFYLGQDEGEERLYVIASAQPMQGLEDLYTQYDQANDGADKQQALSTLLSALEIVEEDHPEEAAGWVFAFDHR